MSHYTTGELARQCEISVRTVQFYDTKGLLSPTDFSEGGRRLYSEEDLKQMRLILMLKSLGLSLESVKGVLNSPSPSRILGLLLDEQLKRIDTELKAAQAQKQVINLIKKNISLPDPIPVNSIRDMEQMMKSTKKLRRVHGTLLGFGIAMDLLQIGAILVWIFKGIWWPFVALLPFVILTAWLLVWYYYKKTAYVCPECGTTFKPNRKEFFFANHTSKTRKLTCTHCGNNGFCVEVASPDTL